MIKRFRKSILILISLVFVFSLVSSLSAQDKKPFTLEDAMKFKAIRGSIISHNGNWVAYYTKPDRGNTQAIIQSAIDTSLDKKYVIKRGISPKITSDGNWAGAIVKPDVIKAINAKKGKKPKSSFTLINLNSGEKFKFKKVSRFVFSEDSKWVVYKSADKKRSKNKYIGSDIVLRHLKTGAELPIQDVSEFAFDSLGTYFIYAVSTDDGSRNGLFYIKLQGFFNFPQAIIKEAKSHFSNLTWNNPKGYLAFIYAKQNKDKKPDTCSLMLWNIRTKKAETIVEGKDSTDLSSPESWKIPFINELRWTMDGQRLFFGFKPKNDTSETKITVKFNDSNYYNIDTIRKEREMDIWHWNDPRIKPNQKIWWRQNKNRTFSAVYHLNTKKWVQLANLDVPEVEFTENPNYTVGYNDTPYLKEITWDGWYHDLYTVNLVTGYRQKVKERISTAGYISPMGNYLTYFNNKHWYLYNCRTESQMNLNERLKNLPFYDVDFDEPQAPPSYGFGGWMENDAAVLLYDQYDIWEFFTADSSYLNLTAASGRANKITYRLKNLKHKRQFYKRGEPVLVYGYNQETKTRGIYRIDFNILGPEKVFGENNIISIIGKAKDTYKLLYVKQKYNLFPNLWVTDSTFSTQTKVSNVNPDMGDYNWGKTELTRWVNSVGDTLRGWIIKPENMEKGKKYPMLVYFYDVFSKYYNRFFQPYVNHRPCFPVYTGRGYVIFLPDIKYRPGNPGFNATDCIVSGVRHVESFGYIDTNAVGITGHSWGGYQTAFIITQTNTFAAAVAGAPVSNMTSAYSGIRLGSGLARQFQYEKAQSRIGGTIWDSLSNYLNNSPVFQAKKINTPFMLMFGDKDQAVPWQQGIELYLAMRRLNKNCIFLEYRGEPHWPVTFPNKADYALKTLQFFEHYLRNKPAPDWLLKGVEYKGR